ncbi:MAG: imidazole glycerol phosphate synthase subunit HisH [Kofleriaceae bacterium]|nr:imidazole glycerol phosphate synthase subunit HisH [Kofleriaceae bacterium]
MTNVVLVDVCSGNLRSVARALMAAGAAVVQTRDPDVVRRADKIVVPGQGAFGPFMRGLAETGLGEVLTERLRAGTSYLGICLGMQVLFEQSQEQGPAPAPLPGLGLVAGQVERLRGGPGLKIPHMGWNQVQRPAANVTAPRARPEPMLRGIADGAFVYFVHSYAVRPSDAKVIALTTDYGGEFCSAVRQDNLFACQFHPEKSQTVGLAMLRNFVEDKS